MPIRGWPSHCRCRPPPRAAPPAPPRPEAPLPYPAGSAHRAAPHSAPPGAMATVPGPGRNPRARGRARGRARAPKAEAEGRSRRFPRAAGPRPRGPPRGGPNHTAAREAARGGTEERSQAALFARPGQARPPPSPCDARGREKPGTARPAPPLPLLVSFHELVKLNSKDKTNPALNSPAPPRPAARAHTPRRRRGGGAGRAEKTRPIDKTVIYEF